MCSAPKCSGDHYAKGLCKFHYIKLWKQQNKERHVELNRRSFLKHYDQAIISAREAGKRFRKKYPWKENARAAKRRASKRRATPSWADLKAIAEFYKQCPAGYHVDHIYPLNSDLVCGLHTLSNLQYLPALENIRKSNRVE